MKRLLFLLIFIASISSSFSQLAVTDPVAVGQRAALSLESLDEALKQTGELSKQYETTKKMFDTSKEYYNQFKNVSNFFKTMTAVTQCYETCTNIKYTYNMYKNGIRKDTYLTSEEKLSAITSCVLILEGTISDIKMLETALKGLKSEENNGLALSDVDRVNMINNINSSLNKANYAMQSLYSRLMSVSKYREYDDQVKSLIYYGNTKWK